VSVEPVEHLLASDGTDLAWEFFHENSKTSLVEPHPIYRTHPTDNMVVGMMHRLRRVKLYADAPKVPLPDDLPLASTSVDDVLDARSSARSFGPGAVDITELTKVLVSGCGVTRDNEDNDFPRPFRRSPSGGALYPLEIYLHAARVDGLAPGLYHYDPEDLELDVLYRGDQSDRMAQYMIQPELFRQAAATLLFSAVFVRSVFKYGDRGYRFVLIEAGHVAQSMLLAAEALGVGAVPIGGYLDRGADRHLGLDGVNESVIYAMHLGQKATTPAGHGAHSTH
jgi:SagB-type dehydrogenase family enzyme